jgi:hypothetical protein
MITKYSSDNFIPQHTNKANEISTADSNDATSILRDFKRAIGLLVLLSVIVTIVLRLFVPGI